MTQNADGGDLAVTVFRHSLKRWWLLAVVSLGAQASLFYWVGAVPLITIIACLWVVLVATVVPRMLALHRLPRMVRVQGRCLKAIYRRREEDFEISRVAVSRDRQDSALRGLLLGERLIFSDGDRTFLVDESFMARTHELLGQIRRRGGIVSE
jgi:hypothetical protein